MDNVSAKNTRLSRLRERMRSESLDAFIVTSPENMRYLSGFRGGEGALLIGHDTQDLYTDFRYTEQAGVEAPDYQVLKIERDGSRSLSGDIAGNAGLKRIGFEGHIVSVLQAQRWAGKLEDKELVPTESLIEEIRSVKDPAEIELLRKAAEIADRAYQHMLTQLALGVTEAEMALELDTFLRKNGAEGPAFDTIIAFGSNSSLPHAISGSRRLEQGDFVLMDFGAIYEGYHSDMTRTVFFGQVSEQQRQLYETVLAAQQSSLAAASAGMHARDVDAVAREFLDDAGYGDRFGHGLGHGIGLQIHELPVLSPSGKVVLEPGMCVTIEPGVYLPGFGGVRIEDSVVITEDGADRITLSPKDLQIVSFLEEHSAL